MGWKEDLEQNKIANRKSDRSKNISTIKKLEQIKKINANKYLTHKKYDVDQVDLHHIFLSKF